MSCVLELKNVSLSIDDTTILKPISFSINKGEVAGYLGPNGAGKTSTIRLILGFLKKSSGNIKIFEKDIEKLKIQDKKRISVLLDQDGLNAFLTGYENLKFFADLYEIKEFDNKVKFWLDKFNIVNISNKLSKHLSKGQKKLFALARTFLMDTELIILDEPFSNLDPDAQQILNETIREYSKNFKKTFFISSHQLSHIEDICDNVGFLRSGELKLWSDILKLKSQNKREEIIVKCLSEDNVIKFKTILSDLQYDYYLKNGCFNIFGEYDSLFKNISEIIVKNNIKTEGIYKQENKTLQEIYKEVLSEK